MRFVYCFILFGLFFTVNAQKISEVTLRPDFKSSCTKPSASVPLDTKIPEGSGLAAWNGMLWTHNDSGKPILFALDSASGKIIKEFKLPGIRNMDWEDLSQDEDYFYLGDTGNNLGNRDTLQVYRIDKNSLINSSEPKIDILSFSWPEILAKRKNTKANFDCEAIVIIKDSIYLFTKEWKMGRRTRVFSISKNPGHSIAKFKSSLRTRVLVTGASYDKKQNLLALVGYNLVLRPYLLVFSNFAGTDFFSGEAKKTKIRKRFRQIEGVASLKPGDYFLISEKFRFWFLHSEQTLFKISLKPVK